MQDLRTGLSSSLVPLLFKVNSPFHRHQERSPFHLSQSFWFSGKGKTLFGHREPWLSTWTELLLSEGQRLFVSFKPMSGSSHPWGSWLGACVHEVHECCPWVHEDWSCHGEPTGEWGDLYLPWIPPSRWVHNKVVIHPCCPTSGILVCNSSPSFLTSVVKLTLYLLDTVRYKGWTLREKVCVFGFRGRRGKISLHVVF